MRNLVSLTNVSLSHTRNLVSFTNVSLSHLCNLVSFANISLSHSRNLVPLTNISLSHSRNLVSLTNGFVLHSRNLASLINVSFIYITPTILSNRRVAPSDRPNKFAVYCRMINSSTAVGNKEVSQLLASFIASIKGILNVLWEFASKTEEYL